MSLQVKPGHEGKGSAPPLSLTTIILDLLEPRVELMPLLPGAFKSFSDGDSDYLNILTLHPAYVAVADGDGSHLIKSF